MHTKLNAVIICIKFNGPQVCHDPLGGLYIFTMHRTIFFASNNSCLE